MNPRSVFIILPFLIVGGGHAQNKKTKVSVNAGTGPYNFGPQTGLTRMNGFTTKAGPFFAAAGLLSMKLEELARSQKHQLRGAAFQATGSGVQADQFSILPYSDFETALKDIKLFDRFKVRLDLISTAIIRKDYVAALYQLRSITTEVEGDVYYDERRPALYSYSLGFFFHGTSSFEFNNLVVSGGEHGVQHNSSASYFMAGSFVPLAGSRAGITGRLGAGVAFGDSYRTVGSISGASYLSPAALDLTGTISTLIKPGKVPKTKLETVIANPQLLSPLGDQYSARLTRTLLDHIRPGDIWLTFSGRQISGREDERVLANGTIGEAELTFALKDVYARSYNSTTLSVAGIYSANKKLGVDELGFGLRTPLFLGTGRSFVSARYGTRGHSTIALEFRF